MSDPELWESIKVAGDQVVATVKRVIHEGNVRRIVVKQGPRVLLEIPMTLGVVGTLVAPVLAAVGALAALLTECTILVERSPGKAAAGGPPAAAGPSRRKPARAKRPA